MTNRTITIGLPTFNRADLLKEALDSLRGQTFSDFELLISDNASTDPRVRELCERAATEDERVRYVRHDKNRGPDANFWCVLEQAQSPYFMWASDDDVWPPDFIARAIVALTENPGFSAWFCQIENINTDGATLREYPSFKRLSSTGMRARDLVRFLWEPEIMGKANLLYSVFRRDALDEIVNIFKELPPAWGSDMALVYAFLCRNNITIDDGVVLQKRVHTSDKVSVVRNPRAHIYPQTQAREYLGNYLTAARGTKYYLLTGARVAARYIFELCHKFARRSASRLRLDSQRSS
jgi:glycosyltransferase involved in cell wall biosynthesis